MAIDFTNYKNELLLDLPITFFGIAIYPLNMSEYISLEQCIPLLTINKNRDINFIQKTKLDYILSMINKENAMGDSIGFFSSTLKTILDICTRTQCSIKYMIGQTSKDTFISINNKIIKAKDFDDLFEIILEQNLPQYDRTMYYDKELEDAIKATETLNNKGKKRVDLERQIMLYSTHTSFSIKQIFETPIRKFFIGVEMIGKEIDYIINKTGYYSGNVKFDRGLLHYLEEYETDGFEGTIDPDGLTQKIASANAY